MPWNILCLILSVETASSVFIGCSNSKNLCKTEGYFLTLDTLITVCLVQSKKTFSVDGQKHTVEIFALNCQESLLRNRNGQRSKWWESIILCLWTILLYEPLNIKSLISTRKPWAKKCGGNFAMLLYDLSPSSLRWLPAGGWRAIDPTRNLNQISRHNLLIFM